SPRALGAEMNAIASSLYHSLHPSGTPPLLPIPLSTPSTSRKAEIPEVDTPPQNRPLLATPRPGCEVRESSATAARRQGPTMAHRRQAADDFAVQHIMRTQALEVGARIEGAFGLTRWIEKMESIFNISGCVMENQVKFATCTLLDATLTWWNNQIRTLGLDAYTMTWSVLKKKTTD
nr:reverse transcriptase domain-containing protein [Tanacetum cinerariifolium]